MIDTAEMAKRAAELDTRQDHLNRQRQELSHRHAELAEHSQLTRHVEAFAEHALAALDDADFDQRQQLLRLVLEDVRVQGRQVEFRLRLPLDDADFDQRQRQRQRQTHRNYQDPTTPNTSRRRTCQGGIVRQ